LKELLFIIYIIISQRLDFNELIKIIKTMTPYYYVNKFKDKINKLIKKANTFSNDDKKIIYLVNNLNESTINLMIVKYYR
jgi:hypothetical protein